MADARDPVESGAVAVAVSALELQPPPRPQLAAAAASKVRLEGRRGEEEKAVVVVEIGAGVDCDREKVCRICHLSPENGEDPAELIELGCGCKDELGAAHRDCAEAWFKLRGNRCCEICGSTAKNITGEDDSSFMVEWHQGRLLSNGANINSSERVSCWRDQPFCNFLMACLVIAFVLPWFFHVHMF